MLSRLRAFISAHMRAVSSSFVQLRLKPLATMATMVVIAVSLTLPALFWVLTDNANLLLAGWNKHGQLTLYLSPGLSPAQQTTVLAKVRRMDAVGHADLKTPDEGLAELQAQEGMADIVRHLPDNPLPGVIDITPAISLHTVAQVEQLYHRLKSIAQVEQVTLDIQWIKRLHTILDFAAKIAHSLMILLSCAVILIVGNTLRLAVHHRHEEIQVLKLIGAGDSFIIRPFLYLGVWYALIGAILAICFVNLFMLSLNASVQALAQAYQMAFHVHGMTSHQAGMLLLLALFLGWSGANIAVRRQLATIEPCN